MSQFREQARRLMGDDVLPATLSVIRSPRVEAMHQVGPGSGLELVPHYDWLLAAGTSDLGLVQLRGPRLRESDLVFTHPLARLWFGFEDQGEDVRARDLTLLADDGRWFVVSAHLTRPRARWIGEFTDLLVARTCDLDPASFV
ncbi:MAG: hypothetical protein ACR2PK_00090 [Acidimicrobiales bacterium]